MENVATWSPWRQQFTESQLGPVLGFALYNAVLLAFLLFTDFNAYDLLVVIYLELWVIGAFALLRLLAAVVFGAPFDTHSVSVSRGASMLFGVLLAGFFIAKFGTLMLMLGFALLYIPGDDIGLSWADATDVHPMVEACVWLLLARYGVMFLWSNLIEGAFEKVSVLSLLFSPYLNAVWVLITIGVGVYLATAYPDSPMLFFSLGVFAAKLVFDLFSLLLDLRRTRLAPQIEARRRRREARARTRTLWLARALVVTVAVVTIGMLVVFGRHLWFQVSLEDDLAARGVIVQGVIAGKSMSESSESTSYSLQVGYDYEAQSFSNPYWIRRDRWERLEEGDQIRITVLPDDPRLSQLTEYVGTSINGRGFISLRRRVP